MKKPGAGAWVAITGGSVLALLFVTCRSAPVELAYPVERGRMIFARQVWSRVQGIFRGSEAEAECIELKRRIAALSLVQSHLERLEAENARLRKTLGYTARNPETWLAASVLSSQGAAAATHDVIRVDKGSLDGVKKGAVVSVPEGLVGRVTDVTLHTSEIMLLTDPTVRVSCEIETESPNPPRGILSGASSEYLLLKHLVRATGAPPRARVITSGFGGVFPRGLEVGTYISDGQVMPSVDFATLEDVFIRREK